MRSMAKKKANSEFDAFVNVRCLAEAKSAMKRLVADLEANPRLRFRGKPVTQDAIIMAGWLWMDELGPEKVAEVLERHVTRLDRIYASRKASAEISEGATALREEDTSHKPPPPLEGERPRNDERPKLKASPRRRN